MTLPRNYLVRSPSSQISEVVNTYENLGDTRNDGIEFGLNYVTKECNWRKLGLEFRASYLKSDSVTTIENDRNAAGSVPELDARLQPRSR